MIRKRIDPTLFKSYNKYGKDHRKDIFRENTYYNYLGEASAFINSVTATYTTSINTKNELKAMLSENHTLVVLSLKAAAHSKTSDSWRKLRRALVITFKAAGLSELAYEIRKINNPVPVSERSHNSKKSKRLTTVTDVMLRDIIKNRMVKNDQDSIDLITLVRLLGIRPSEAQFLQQLENEGNTITVKVMGSKKTLIGEKQKSKSRGLDRVLTVAHNDTLESAIGRAKNLDGRRIKAAQMRIHRASRKMYEKSERHFCLYSLRYTFGSNLKLKLYETEGGRIIAAAIMGHKNTSSISSYGHYRSGNVCAEIPSVDQATLSLVKDDVGDRFGKAGKKFDVGESIRNKSYVKKDIYSYLDI
ncbi:site-specific integrase [Halomonas sp. TRM85114]|uniref:hypothetical protein n=1 Tax=Halomonas jincaotanensis TaxID=2810616 RepID=UPI001BD540E6|nr:hypothetical protein [Halomonas jincaotanensis]MBS9405599.1 site-specific integrase [Halomonas jincaotanensis]